MAEFKLKIPKLQIPMSVSGPYNFIQNLNLKESLVKSKDSFIELENSFDNLDIEKGHTWFQITSNLSGPKKDVSKSFTVKSSILSSFDTVIFNKDQTTIFLATSQTSVRFNDALSTDQAKTIFSKNQLQIIKPLLNFSSQYLLEVTKNQLGMPIMVDYLHEVTQSSNK